MMTPEAFVAALRAVGEGRYHHLHPFHVRMNAGELSPEQIRVWVANRFYYQKNIPVKDAGLIANCPEREVRRLWLHRIVDHDGREGEEGGIEAWVRLGEACGLKRGVLWADAGLLPGVRFAVEAYVQFARTKPWPVAVASSLTEMFAPDLMAERLAAFRKYYTWVPDWGFDYFQRRVTQSRTDSDEALALALRWCDTPELQREAVAALRFKCDVLWSLLDAIDAAASR
jgi:pyrroloquinoline-quinone synthase